MNQIGVSDLVYVQDPKILLALFSLWAIALIFYYVFVLPLARARPGHQIRIEEKTAKFPLKNFAVYAVGWILIVLPILFIWWNHGARL